MATNSAKFTFDTIATGVLACTATVCDTKETMILSMSKRLI